MTHKLLSIMLFLLTLPGCGGFYGKVPAPVDRVEPAPAAIESRPAHSAAGSAVKQLPSAHAELMFHVLTSLGIDYQNGGRSPRTGFDCSGLVAHVYEEAFGVRLPHGTAAQSRLGVPVANQELVPGDLVFYNTLNRPYSHVGIYLGAGRFVHAPKSGSQVRVESMRTRYWSERYNGARRIASSG